MKKIQTCEQPMFARLRELDWQQSGKKRTYLTGRFRFPYFQNGAK